MAMRLFLTSKRFDFPSISVVLSECPTHAFETGKNPMIHMYKTLNDCV